MKVAVQTEDMQFPVVLMSSLRNLNHSSDEFGSSAADAKIEVAGHDAGKFCRVQRMDKCRIVKRGDAIRGDGLNR
jgi:hypothetical protein